MIFCHKSLEIGCGDAVWTRPMLLPFDKEAVGNPPKHAEHQNAFVALNAAPVVVVGNIEALVKAALNAPTLAVEFQPAGSIESLRWRTGDQSHFLIFATLGLTQ
jgi:fumarate reductase subunit C